MPKSANVAERVREEGAGLPVEFAAPPEAVEPRQLHCFQAAAQMILAVAAVLGICYVAALPILVLLISILLAFILAPVADVMVRLRVPRGLASLVAVLLLLALVYGGFYVSYNRGQAFLRELPRYRSEIQQTIVHIKQQTESITRTASGILPDEPQSNNSVVASQPIAWTDWVTHSLGPITEIVFTASLIPFLVYFMLSWQEHAHSATVMLFREENRRTAYVTLGLISAMIRSFIVGNVLMGLFMSLISTVVFAVLGLPYSYFLGFISGYLSLVPYLGVLLAIVPPVIIGLGHVHSTGLIVIVITVVGLHLVATNVLYPKFLGSRLQLNPLAVTLALLFWGWLWGAMGLVLSVPITAALKIILDHIEALQPYGAWLGESRFR